MAATKRLREYTVVLSAKSIAALWQTVDDNGNVVPGTNFRRAYAQVADPDNAGQYLQNDYPQMVTDFGAEADAAAVAALVGWQIA